MVIEPKSIQHHLELLIDDHHLRLGIRPSKRTPSQQNIRFIMQDMADVLDYDHSRARARLGGATALCGKDGTDRIQRYVKLLSPTRSLLIPSMCRPWVDRDSWTFPDYGRIYSHQ